MSRIVSVVRTPFGSPHSNARALPDGSTVKAVELSGQDGILFLTNSQTGALEARPRGERTGIELNSALHAN